MASFREKIIAIFSQSEKVYLLHLDFSGNWDSFRLIGIFFNQLGKKLVPETGPSFAIEKRPWYSFY